MSMFHSSIVYFEYNSVHFIARAPHHSVCVCFDLKIASNNINNFSSAPSVRQHLKHFSARFFFLSFSSFVFVSISFRCFLPLNSFLLIFYSSEMRSRVDHAPNVAGWMWFRCAVSTLWCGTSTSNTSKINAMRFNGENPWWDLNRKRFTAVAIAKCLFPYWTTFHMVQMMLQSHYPRERRKKTELI